MAPRHREGRVGCAPCPGKETAAQEPSINEKLLQATIGAIGSGRADESAHADLVPIFARQRNHAARELRTEYVREPLLEDIARRQNPNFASVVLERKGGIGIGESDRAEPRRDASKFRGDRFEEFTAYRYVRKQLSRDDARSGRCRNRMHVADLFAVRLDARADVAGVGSRRNLELRNGSNACQSFTAKTERDHAPQIIGLLELARRMAPYGEGELIGRDTVAVVDDFDLAQPARGDPHGDAMRVCIQGVFDELFDDRDGTFDHLSRGDLSDRLGIEKLDQSDSKSRACSLTCGLERRPRSGRCASSVGRSSSACAISLARATTAGGSPAMRATSIPNERDELPRRTRCENTGAPSLVFSTAVM